MPPANNPPPEIRALLSGLAIGESPRWHDSRLFLAHWGAGEIIAVDPARGGETVLRVPSAFQFSLDWLPDGRLLVITGREGLLLRREADGVLATLADLNPLSDRGWNELVVDGRGNAYVNGTGFDLMAGEAFAPGIIALVTPDGRARPVADGLAFPNGMAVTPDNRTLIVAESYARRLTAFDIAVDGSLASRRVWADLGDPPDGICIDAEGAVWYAEVPGKSCVRVREGGTVLQRIALDRGCFACMLGGHGRSTLFMLAAEWRGIAAMREAARTGVVLATTAPTAGAGWP